MFSNGGVVDMIYDQRDEDKGCSMARKADRKHSDATVWELRMNRLNE